MEPPVYSSLVQRLLRTNEPPLEGEVYHVREILKEAEKDLSHLDDEINRVDAILQELLWQRRRLRKFVDDHAGCISPIRRLSGEILSEIALHAFGRYTDSPVAVTTDTKKGAWVLGKVCRSWRDAFLSFQSLWSVVDVSQSTSYRKRKKDPNAELLAELFRRSGEMPLTITVILHRGRASDTLDFLKDVFLHCHRWKNVVIGWSVYQPQLLKLNELKGKLPCLETLELTIETHGPREEIDILDHRLDAFELAPRLRSLTLSMNKRLQIMFPWSQLTRYEQYGYHPPHDHAQILSELSNVVDVSLNSIEEPPTSLIRLPCLRKLFLNGPQSHLNPVILDNIAAPAIQHLNIGAGFDDLTTSISNFIARSVCTLHFLGIEKLDKTVVDFLGTMSTLTSLLLNDTPYDPNLVSLLTVQDVSQPPLLPNLKKFTWVIEHDRGYDRNTNTINVPDGDALAAMVQSRWTCDANGFTVARLESFCLSVYQPTTRSAPRPVRSWDSFEEDGWDDHLVAIAIEQKDHSGCFDQLREQGLEAFIINRSGEYGDVPDGWEVEWL